MFKFFEGALGEMLAPVSGTSNVFFLAIQHHKDKEVQDLMMNSRDTDMSGVNENGYSSIHCACRYNNVLAMDLILSRGINSRPSIVIIIITIILSPGVPIETTDNTGNTPLHYAAKYGHHELCKNLVAKGAFAGKKNGDGKTPYDVAESHTVRQYLLPLQFQSERGGQNDSDINNNIASVKAVSYGGIQNQQMGYEHQGQSQHQIPLPMPQIHTPHQYGAPNISQNIASNQANIPFQTSVPSGLPEDTKPAMAYNNQGMNTSINMHAIPVSVNNTTPSPFNPPPVSVPHTGPGLFNSPPMNPMTPMNTQFNSAPARPFVNDNSQLQPDSAATPPNCWPVASAPGSAPNTPGLSPPGPNSGPPAQTVYRPAPTSSSNHRIIQPDGFHTSASDPELQKKYGHTRNIIDIAPPPIFSAMNPVGSAAPPQYNMYSSIYAQQGQGPSSGGGPPAYNRYVAYDPYAPQPPQQQAPQQQQQMQQQMPLQLQIPQQMSQQPPQYQQPPQQQSPQQPPQQQQQQQSPSKFQQQQQMAPLVVSGYAAPAAPVASSSSFGPPASPLGKTVKPQSFSAQPVRTNSGDYFNQNQNQNQFSRSGSATPPTFTASTFAEPPKIVTPQNMTVNAPVNVPVNNPVNVAGNVPLNILMSNLNIFDSADDADDCEILDSNSSSVL